MAYLADLISDNQLKCKRCGKVYGWVDQQGKTKFYPISRPFCECKECQP
jgi:hypothetical protein